jgi:hypothetical protein
MVTNVDVSQLGLSIRILWLSGSNAKNNAELLSACTHWDSLHVTRYAKVPKPVFEWVHDIQVTGMQWNG